jgi:hypothetical protein
MPYTVQQLDNLPVPTVLATMTEPFDTGKEAPVSIGEVNATLAQIEGDLVYIIIDLSQLNLNLGNLMQGFAMAYLPHEEVRTEHMLDDRVRTLMIGTGEMMKIAVKSLQQDQYGNHHVELFPTVDEALAHIRQARPAGKA